MKTLILTEKDLVQAAALLKRGELVAFPTETVYGLGAPIFELASIQKIFSVKGRPRDNPLIAHLANLSDCEKVAQDLPTTFFQLAEAFFPGPLTLVVKRNLKVPKIASAGLETIAIRMPSHFVAHRLINAVGLPLVAPSANLSGSPSSTTAQHVLNDFNGKIAAVVDAGPCQYGIESTVLDLVSFDRPTLLRPGQVTQESLEEVLGCEIVQYKSGPKRSPGMKYRHYAPKVPVRIFSKKNAFDKHLAKGAKALILSNKEMEHPYLSLQSKTLYAHLRLADQKGYDEVVIFCEKCSDNALLNRLEKINESNRS